MAQKKLVTPESPVAAVKEKQRAEAFVNSKVLNADGSETGLRSSKGFPIFDNQYTTKFEKQLVALAQKRGGKVTVKAELTIALNSGEEFDIDSISVVEA